MTDNDSHEPPERRFWRIWHQVHQPPDDTEADVDYSPYAAMTRQAIAARRQRSQTEQQGEETDEHVD